MRKVRSRYAPTRAKPPRRAVRFGVEATARFGRQVAEPVASDIFAPAIPPAGVVPDGKGMAMDDASAFSSTWATSSYGPSLGGYAGVGQAIPMTALALLYQRPEYRKIVDVPAVEMTRKWIKIGAVEDEASKSDVIDGINMDLARFKVRDAFRDAIRADGAMGRGHVFIDLGSDGDELASPIGASGDKAMIQKVRKGSLKSIRSISPLWVYPQGYNAKDPLAPDWYRPQTWFVMGQPVHTTRLLTIVGREVDDILKPAYSFGGLSLIQVTQPYVDNFIRTWGNVADLVHSFNVFVLKTNMGAELQGGSGGGTTGFVQPDSTGIDGRVAGFNYYRNNLGTFVIDQASEDFANVSANLGTLDALQAQSFEYVVAMSGQAMVKYAGIQPSGLNASSDGEIRVFYDSIHAAQEDHLRDPLQTVIDIIQLNRFGVIDPTIRFWFEPLYAMSETERAGVEKTEAETDQVRIDSGVLHPEEVRQNIADDPDSRYPGLDVADVPSLEEEEAEGLQPKGGETGADDVEGLFGAE